MYIISDRIIGPLSLFGLCRQAHLYIIIIIINFVMDRVAQKARPANVLPHKHTNTNTHTISNYIHTYIQVYKLPTT